MDSLQKFLLRWYDKNKRPLPWRPSHPDPYHVWISEIMLQQTQVETALPYYQRFLEVLPTLQSLADVPVEEVLKLWSGLGYYSRARNLHKAAHLLTQQYRGKFPKTKQEWLELPGIGEYTAGAIASIAFGERVPVVDGNVIRVLTRLFALSGDPKKTLLKEKLWKLATSLVPQARPGDFNQALMELGALVCLPKGPRCGGCPLKTICLAYKKGQVDSYPTPQKKGSMKRVLLTASLIEKEGFFLLAKRNGQRHLQSMWEFPQTEPAHLGLKVGEGKRLAIVRHAIMNRSIRLTPYWYRFVSGKPERSEKYVGYRWIRAQELEEYPTSSLNYKIVKSYNNK